jgi:hypothetical protein
MIKSFLRPETAIFLGIWVLLMVLGRNKLFGDPGSYWHIVVGERILASGELIHSDPFSFTFAGQPWIAQWWLGECALALLHRFGGLDTILLATATVLAGLYTWVAHRLLRRGLHPLLAVALTSLAMAASAYHFHPRPHLINLVLLGWTFARLCDFEAGRIPLRRLFWLVPLFVIWTNVHGGMLGGVGTLAVATAGWGFAKWIGQDTPLVRYRQLIPLGALTLACALTAFLNPYGAELPRVWFALLGSPVLPRLIQEHAPLLYSGWVAWPVVLFALLYLAALIGVLPRWPRVTWLIPLIWFVLTWTRIRHGPLFAITAVIALGDMFPHIRWVSWLARKGSDVCRLRAPEYEAPGRGLDWKPVLIPLLMVLTTAAIQVAGLPVPVVGRGWAQFDPKPCPLGLLPELRACEGKRPNRTPIFNEMLFGGFLIYYTPDLRVFIDDRCELYGDQWLEQYADAAWHHPEQIEQWAKEYGFDHALVQADSGFDRYLANSPGEWTLEVRTDSAALYRRKANPAELLNPN